MQDDWISPWWQAACLPDRWDVCGVSVPSLSVWHTFALENIGNAYLCGGPIDKDAAASLLLFASTDYRGGRKLMQLENHRGRRMRRMFKKLRPQDMLAAHEACQEYVDTCMRGVSRWNRNGKPCGAPYQYHIVARLSGGDPFKIERVWNMPYATARAMCDAVAEQNGDDSLMTLKAQKMEDNWDESDKEAMAN